MSSKLKKVKYVFIGPHTKEQTEQMESDLRLIRSYKANPESEQGICARNELFMSYHDRIFRLVTKSSEVKPQDIEEITNSIITEFIGSNFLDNYKADTNIPFENYIVAAANRRIKIWQQKNNVLGFNPSPNILSAVRKSYAALCAQGNNDPSAQEIYDYIISVLKPDKTISVNVIDKVVGSGKVTSLNAHIRTAEGNDGSEFGDLLPDKRQESLQESIPTPRLLEFNKATKTLSERTYEILLDYYAYEMPLRAIADKWGITHQRVDQIIRKAIKKVSIYMPQSMIKENNQDIAR